MMSAIKNVVLFGCTGFTGKKVLQQALSKDGWIVTAFVRDEEKIPAEVRENEGFKNKLKIVKGDVTNLNDVKNGVSGQDAVIVTLGTRNDLSPTTMMSEGMKNIVTAMKEAGVKRVSVCISAFLFFEDDKIPPIFVNVSNDHRLMYTTLKESGLDYVAVFPPHIADIPGDVTKYTANNEEEKNSNYRGRHVSVNDLAHFLIECLSKPEYFKNVVGIYTPREEPAN